MIRQGVSGNPASPPAAEAAAEAAEQQVLASWHLCAALCLVLMTSIAVLQRSGLVASCSTDSAQAFWTMLANSDHESRMHQQLHPSLLFRGF